jgi:hypothetical protein
MQTKWNIVEMINSETVTVHTIKTIKMLVWNASRTHLQTTHTASAKTGLSHKFAWSTKKGCSTAQAITI